jgi:hypothetical protein
VHDAWLSESQCRRVVPDPLVQPEASRLHPNELDIGLVEEGREEAEGVASSAHASNQNVWVFANQLPKLVLGLVTDNRLKVAHHARVGVGAHSGPNGEEHGLWVSHVGTKCRVNCLLERLLPVRGRDNLCTQHLEKARDYVGAAQDGTVRRVEGARRKVEGGVEGAESLSRFRI